MLVAAAFALTPAGCGGGGGEADDAIARDVFVAAYADLRRAALDAGGGAVDGGVRDSVLAAHGVSEDDLLRFADVHGADGDFMRRVWDDVELRVDPPAPPDSAGAPGAASDAGGPSGAGATPG